MAKFGETKQEYDPFNTISDSLSALSAPPAAPAAAPETRERVEEPKPEPKPATARKTPRPASRPEPQPQSSTPKAEPEPERSGGGIAPAARQVPDQVDQSVALRITKRIKISKQEAARLDVAALRLSATLGIGVDLSKITRALWEIYLTHEEEILRSLPDDAVPAKRPANHDAIGLAELDERLASMIGEGLMMASMRSRRNG